jgi:hypothetical protein
MGTGYVTISRKLIAGGIVLAVGSVVFAGGSTAFAKAKPGKKAGKPQIVLGAVKSVDSNTITVEAKKGGSRQFQLTGDTTYKLRGKKGAADENATKTDLKEGERVAVTAKGDTAQAIVIEGAHKKSKKKA